MSTNDGEIKTFVTPLCFITLKAAIFGAYDLDLSKVFCYEFNAKFQLIHTELWPSIGKRGGQRRFRDQ